MWISEALKQSFKDKENKMVEIIKSTDFSFISIGVFGSYARGEYKLTSDIDVCIIVEHLPDRSIKGYLYEEADMLGIDLVFLTEDYFNNDTSKFIKNIRRDFKEVYRC